MAFILSVTHAILETELCMFVDDTQLFNKNEESGF
jgi:hypothetical protein